MYKLLNHINSVANLRALNLSDLPALSDELRTFLQENTNTKEGHINSSLGVAELTVALHYSFNTPEDILIWDVGHQAYIHKILTDRKDTFKTNRKLGGVSGFTKRDESKFDPFGAGHSSTSISAACGFALSAKLKGINRKHIAVIGDGALTGGMSFEALNYLGSQGLDVLIVHNDNQISIDKNVGALADTGNYEQYVEALGINYFGKIDGHNTDAMLQAFDEIKKLKGPVFITVKTIKGRGSASSKRKEGSKKGKSFQEVFSSSLIQLAEKNLKVVAITPAMLSGSGLDKFKEKFPERTFDVGIAEQNAVTLAAGMAADGYIPVCHLYSTFAQRGYDQIIHDVALQNLPVVFCLDRSGLVGEDGATHHGAFDIGFLNAIPNITLSSPMDGDSLTRLLEQAIEAKMPFVIRYNKGGDLNENAEGAIKPGKGRWLKKGKDKVIISYGFIGQEAKRALEGTPYAHFDLVYLKPMDLEVTSILRDYKEVITLEESTFSGGIGQTILSLKNELDLETKVTCLHLPDEFVEHGSREELLDELGLNAMAISKKLTT